MTKGRNERRKANFDPLGLVSSRSSGFLLWESLIFRIILRLFFGFPILKSGLQKAVFRILRAFLAVFHAWAINSPPKYKTPSKRLKTALKRKPHF